jgi:hypothetical protein
MYEKQSLNAALAAGSSDCIRDGLLKGVPQIKDIGIVREAMKDTLATTPATFAPAIDGRWAVHKPPAH